VIVVPFRGRALCVGALEPDATDATLLVIASELGIQAEHPEPDPSTLIDQVGAYARRSVGPAKGATAERSDATSSSVEGASGNTSSARDAHGEPADAEDSDAEGSDAEGPDAGDSDAEGPDAGDSDAEDSDAEDSDAEGSDAEDSDAEGSDAKDSDPPASEEPEDCRAPTASSAADSTEDDDAGSAKS
jgi:hypothetical protein